MAYSQQPKRKSEVMISISWVDTIIGLVMAGDVANTHTSIIAAFTGLIRQSSTRDANCDTVMFTIRQVTESMSQI